ncbi:hypothetical protein IWW55_003279, partial [Coemansia sp. RSA 2706]
MRALVTHCVRLEALRVAECSDFDDDSVAMLAAPITEFEEIEQEAERLLRAEGAGKGKAPAGAVPAWQPMAQLRALELVRPHRPMASMTARRVVRGLGKQLRVLDLAGFRDLADDFLDDLGASCPNLQELGLASCDSIGAAAMAAYFAGLRGRQALRAGHGFTRVDLSRCYMLTDRVVQELVRHSGATLRRLALNSVDDNLTLNGVLALGGFMYGAEGGKARLEEQTAGCGCLEELDLSWVRCTTDAALEQILPKCKGLAQVSVYGCGGVTAFAPARAGLRYVGRECDTLIHPNPHMHAEAAAPSALVGAVRAGHELDTARLTEFLASAMDIAQPIALAQFNVGQSNPTYLVTDARGRRFVLRKKPAGALLSKTAHAVEREFRVLRALGEHTRVPVPRVYALCEDARVVGTPFYLMEYLEGRVLSDIRLPGVAAAERPRYWRALVDVLSELHKVDIERVGLASFGKPRGFYERQLRSLTRVAEAQAAATDSDGRAVGALRRLGELQKWFARQWCPDETAVVHGDFKMDNVVWDAREPRIIGVLDWELSTLGNPRTDLANLLQPLLVPYHVNFERGGVLQGLRDAPAEENVPAEGELLRRYCRNMGREYPMAGWEYAKVFGLFRNAVIQQGVAARVARGQASSAFAHLVGEVFPRTMDMAMAIVDQIEARTLAPCVEHNSPAFDADGLRWVFKLFKGRARSPNELALYLAVHESTGERLQRQRKKVDVSFTLENLRTRGLDYSKHQGPITVWVDSVYSTWGDDRFVALSDMEAFTADDTACLVVRFHVRETVVVGAPTAQPSPAIAVFVPERIAAPFNRLLRSARFSDIQFELRDSAALLLSPGPRTPGDTRGTSYAKSGDALGISYAKPGASYPTPPEPHSRSPCITPMPGDTGARALPYAHQPRLGAASPPPAPPGPRYHAHKAILMAVSPVFEAMFGNGMRETFERVVEVWDVTPRAFERLLEYAYTHTCELPADLSADELVETLLCADQFAVAGLLNT